MAFFNGNTYDGGKYALERSTAVVNLPDTQFWQGVDSFPLHAYNQPVPTGAQGTSDYTFITSWLGRGAFDQIGGEGHSWGVDYRLQIGGGRIWYCYLGANPFRGVASRNLAGGDLREYPSTDFFTADQNCVIHWADNFLLVGMEGDSTNGANMGKVVAINVNGDVLWEVTSSDDPTTPVAEERFGTSVYAGCGRVVVASFQYIASGSSDRDGKFWIFDYSGNFIASVTGTELDNTSFSNLYLATAVAIGSNRIAVLGQWSDVSGGNHKIYIFDLSGNLLNVIQQSPPNNNFFGGEMEINNGVLYVTAWWHDTLGTNNGMLYMYTLDGTLIAEMTTANPSGRLRTSSSDMRGLQILDGRCWIGYDEYASGGGEAGEIHFLADDGYGRGNTFGNEGNTYKGYYGKIDFGASPTKFFGENVVASEGYFATAGYGQNLNGNLSGQINLYSYSNYARNMSDVILDRGRHIRSLGI